MTFSESVFEIDPAIEISRISTFIKQMTFKSFKGKGAVRTGDKKTSRAWG